MTDITGGSGELNRTANHRERLSHLPSRAIVLYTDGFKFDSREWGRLGRLPTRL